MSGIVEHQRNVGRPKIPKSHKVMEASGASDVETWMPAIVGHRIMTFHERAREVGEDPGRLCPHWKRCVGSNAFDGRTQRGLQQCLVVHAGFGSGRHRSEHNPHDVGERIIGVPRVDKNGNARVTHS